MIKAIETKYKGYRFRSRLEARWAVFFDSLGVKYQYEPEGFELSTGWYLPDFWLPDFGFYVEIKPFPQEWEHTSGVYDLEEEHPILKVLLICGTPQEYKTQDYTDNGLADEGVWMECEYCNGKGFGHIYEHDFSGASLCECGRKYFSEKLYFVRKATAAAMSARFEHGECG